MADDARVRARAEVQWINHLLDDAPHDAVLWFRKAALFADAMAGTIPHRTLLDRVVLWYEQCLRADPSSWAAHFNSAVALRELNRHEEALAHCRAAVQARPDDERVRRLLEQTLARLGEYPGAADEFHLQFEAADPQLFTLQTETGELVDLGLHDLADNLCVAFELEHGVSGLTRSLMEYHRLRRAADEVPVTVPVTRAYPLLELTGCARHELVGLVKAALAPGAAGEVITAHDVNDFDEHTRWLMRQLGDPGFDPTDPRSATQPLPAPLARVWAMAATNFVVARAFDHPMLVTYTATTLAEFYAGLGLPTLPFVLYNIAAVQADRAGQANYATNAHGRCAQLLRDRDRLGAAVRHLQASLRHEARMTPENRFGTYTELAECQLALGQFERAEESYRSAGATDGLDEPRREHVRLALLGLSARDTVAHVAWPPVVCAGLEVATTTVESPEGPLVLGATSRHELYDSLLQAVDSVHRHRRSLTDRQTGDAYLGGYAEQMDALVRTALEIGLPANALRHLEEQKCVILNGRLRYLVDSRPEGVPEPLWDDLQRLLAVHRQLVDPAVDPAAEADLTGPTFPDLADAIAVKLWQCAQAAGEAAVPLRRRLAFGRLPERIDCRDAAETLILEFCPQACLLIRPDDPRNPTAIALPEATAEEAERLAHELADIVEDWVQHFMQAPSLASRPDDTRFRRFVERLDEVFFRPLAPHLETVAASRLCLIPYRVLHLLPLNLLGLSQGRPLADGYALAFAPSLVTLGTLNDRPPRRPQRFLVVADPVPRCPDSACHRPDHDCWSLEGARREGAALAERVRELGLDATYLAGAAARYPRLTAELPGADVVHLGTHGFFDGDQPGHSGVLLALADGGDVSAARFLRHDGGTDERAGARSVGQVCTLEQIWQGVDMLGCRLLNLSACSSGMTHWSDRSDEFYGLANGFLYSGAQAVLTNLWPVDDHANGLFNRLFYDALIAADGVAATALATAVEQFRTVEVDGGTPYAHPWFWAGYRIVGST